VDDLPVAFTGTGTRRLTQKYASTWLDVAPKARHGCQGPRSLHLDQQHRAPAALARQKRAIAQPMLVEPPPHLVEGTSRNLDGDQGVGAGWVGVEGEYRLLSGGQPKAGGGA